MSNRCYLILAESPKRAKLVSDLSFGGGVDRKEELREPARELVLG